ncbi:MAG: segregation and condensation protein A [Thermodesulfobacteriota bacterium]
MEQLELPYLVKLQVFEGPLDLLLQLIRKDKVDIYDIPIAKVTEQYLEYLDILKKCDLEVVGDYLALAAQLSLIKSRMLLPQPPSEDEEEDPRAELVKRLLEYERYKEAAEELEKRDILGKEVFLRGLGYFDEFGEMAEETEILKTDLWSLIEAFREVYERKNFNLTEDIVFTLESYSIEEKTTEILNFIKFKGKTVFKDLFLNLTSKVEVIITFLAILEMVKNEKLGIVQEDFEGEVELTYLGDEGIAEQ